MLLNNHITMVAFLGDFDFFPTIEIHEENGTIRSLENEKRSRDAVAIEATAQAKIDINTNNKSA